MAHDGNRTDERIYSEIKKGSDEDTSYAELGAKCLLLNYDFQRYTDCQ